MLPLRQNALSSDDPTHNLLLAALPTAELARLRPHLEPVTLALGKLVYGPGDQLQCVYFPLTAIVSLHYVMETGDSAESAGVGNDGVVGISLFMGGDTTPSSAVVHAAGRACRLDRRVMYREFERAEAFQRTMLRYTQGLMEQISQTAVCNRHHALEQQLCRWLLLTLDRMPTNDLVLTQNLVANMLGVRRESVTEAAGRIKRAGAIEYRRGHISVLDRAALESRACECYAVMRKLIDRMLADVRG